MIVAGFLFVVLMCYLPGIIAIIFDEFFKIPRARPYHIFELWSKVHFVGCISFVAGGAILSHESLLGEVYVNSLLDGSTNFDRRFIRYLPTLLASTPIALFLSWGWGQMFHNRKVVSFIKRKIIRDPTHTEFAADMPTFIKLNNIKFVSIWDKEYGQQITGKIERVEEEGKTVTFLLSDAIVYNSVGEELRKAKTHRLVRRKDKLIVAFTEDFVIPGGRLRIQTKQRP